MLTDQAPEVADARRVGWVLSVDDAELVLLGLIMCERNASVMTPAERQRLPALVRELNVKIMRAAPFRYADTGPGDHDAVSADGEPARAPAGAAS